MRLFFFFGPVALTKQGEIAVIIDSSWGGVENPVRQQKHALIWNLLPGDHSDSTETETAFVRKASENPEYTANLLSFLYFFFFFARSQYYIVVLLRVHPCPPEIPFSFFFSLPTLERLQGWFELHHQTFKKKWTKWAPCATGDTRLVLRQRGQTPEDLWTPLLSTKQNMRFYFKKLLMYISKGIDGKDELSTQSYCLSTHKNISECQKKIHYSVGQLGTDNTPDELAFLNGCFDKVANVFLGLYIIGRSSLKRARSFSVSVLTPNHMFAERFSETQCFWVGGRSPHLTLWPRAAGRLISTRALKGLTCYPTVKFVPCSDSLDPKLMIHKCAKWCK